MKTTLVFVLAAIQMAAVSNLRAQDTRKSAAADEPKAGSVQSSPEKPKPSPDELEAKFKDTLTAATMKGRWCSIKDGVLGPEKEDKYTIVGVTKISSEAWIINARIQYGNRDMVAPIPVKVKWAGETPMIIVDNIPIPGGGVYSARVLIYERTYAGSWTGGDHAGLLNGIITTEKELKPREAK